MRCSSAIPCPGVNNIRGERLGGASSRFQKFISLDELRKIIKEINSHSKLTEEHIGPDTVKSFGSYIVIDQWKIHLPDNGSWVIREETENKYISGKGGSIRTSLILSYHDGKNIDEEVAMKSFKSRLVRRQDINCPEDDSTTIEETEVFDLPYPVLNQIKDMLAA